MGRYDHRKQPLRDNKVLRGSYRINRVLGSGGFALTYLACHIGLDHQVAVKEYIPSNVAMRAADGETVLAQPGEEAAFQMGLAQFTDEARTLASFRHRSIVGVADIFECNGTAYIILEYVDGESLAARLDRVGNLDEAAILSVLDPILGALNELHLSGILHRDIKPDNILLRSNGCPVVIDFGNARSIEGPPDKERPVTLTPGYAPIEQYLASGEEGPWTDIYALGAMLYRSVTGLTPPDAKERVIADPYIPAREAAVGRYSPGLLLAIDRALSMRPDSRPRSIDEFRSVLDTPTRAGKTIIPTGKIGEAPTSIAKNRNLYGSQLPGRVALGAALFVAIAAGTVYLDQFGRRRAEAVRVAAEVSRKATERAQRESAQRRELARWERAAEIATEQLAQRRSAQIEQQRAIEAARRERQEEKRQRLQALERRRAEAIRRQAERASPRQLTEKRARADNNPLTGFRRLFLGALPR